MPGVALESVLNPTSLRRRQVAKQPKYNGNPQLLPQFQREFTLWVKSKKVGEGQILTGLFHCLEKPTVSTCLRSWSDRDDASAPLTFSEVWEQLEVRASRLLEDLYHQMPNIFPSFSRSIPHELQNQKQRF